MLANDAVGTTSATTSVAHGQPQYGLEGSDQVDPVGDGNLERRMEGSPVGNESLQESVHADGYHLPQSGCHDGSAKRAAYCGAVHLTLQDALHSPGRPDQHHAVEDDGIHSVEEYTMDSVDRDDNGGNGDSTDCAFRFTLPTDKLQCELRLPGRDGAAVQGCAGTEQGYSEGQEHSGDEQDALELMLNIFAFMGKWDLKAEAVKDMLAMLKHVAAVSTPV